MYEIECFIESKVDLDNFLVKTGKFGKKFYTVEYFLSASRPPYFFVKAIAISRDLIYVVKWTIDCDGNHYERNVERYTLGVSTEEDTIENRARNLYMPVPMEVRKMWYPCYDDESYVDVFEYNGFVKVDKIEKEGAW